MDKMTEKEALNLLDQASGMAPLTRAIHVQVQEAVTLLKKLVDSSTLKDKKNELQK